MLYGEFRFFGVAINWIEPSFLKYIHIFLYSYLKKFVTMVGMWIIPFLISLKFVHMRFLIIWIFFTSITTVIFFKATKTPLDKSTPRWLYKWFLLVHKISYFLGVLGYIGLMLTFLGFNFLFFVSPTVIFFI